MIGFKSIPIFIHSKNRLSCLKRLIDRLVRDGYDNIHVVDIGTTYPPLLAYYKTISGICQIHHCGDVSGFGYHAVWTFDILKKLDYRNKHFVTTDPDIVPTDTCPHDYVERFWRLLERNPQFPKAGFGLRIDNLPDCYAKKQEVIRWESQYWTKPVEPEAYDAKIDSTFALYRPTAYGLSDAIRTGGLYVAEHTPWYADSANPTDEGLFYASRCHPGVNHW